MAVSSRTARLPLIATFGTATVIVPERTPLRFAPSETRWPAPLVRLIAPPPSTRLALLTVTSTTGPVAPVVWVRARSALSSCPATAMVALLSASRMLSGANCSSTPAPSVSPGMLVVTLAAIEPLMPPAPSTTEPVAMAAVTTPPPRLSVAAAMATRVVRTPAAFSREISRVPTCRVCPAIDRSTPVSTAFSGTVAAGVVSTCSETVASLSPRAGTETLAARLATSPAADMVSWPLMAVSDTAPPSESAPSVTVTAVPAVVLLNPKAPVSDCPAKARVASATWNSVTPAARFNSTSGSPPAAGRLPVTAPLRSLYRTVVTPVRVTPPTPMTLTVPVASSAYWAPFLTSAIRASRSRTPTASGLTSPSSVVAGP